MILQITRRLVQMSVLLLVVGIAYLSLYAHYRAARVIEDPVLMKGLRSEGVTQTIHEYASRLEDPQPLLDGNKGTLWSMRFMGYSISDPLAAVEMFAASRHIHLPLLASILLPVLLTLVLGRVFCSWICPGYLLFEVTGKLRRLLRLAEITPGDVRFSHANKYVFLGVGTLLAAIFSTPLFALIYPPAVISRAIHAWIFGTTLTGMLVLLGLIVAFELFVSPRWWCRTMCPGGALYALLGWLRPVRVRLRTERCTGCRECIPVCEAGINPITQSASIECDNCGVCLRHCGHGALYFTIGLPGRSRSRRQPLPAPATTTLSLVIMMLVPLLVASRADGHHILGLPHYSYKENYPQRPTLEYPATSGPYDILLTSYPGVPVPGETTTLAFYIKSRQSGQVYPDPVSLRLLRTHTFGDSTTILPATRIAPMDNQHKYWVDFPDEGEYVVELSVLIEGQTEVIPFRMTAGEPTAATSWVILGASGGLFTFVVARAVQIKRRRRAAAMMGATA